jgi:hypothetical protein
LVPVLVHVDLAGNPHQLSQVVSEHGPAKHVTVSQVEGGKYHVSTRHEDGFKHESDHDSGSDAFDAAGALSGVDLDRQNAQDMGNPSAAML